VSRHDSSIATGQSAETEDSAQRRLDRFFARVARVYGLQLPLERRALLTAARMAEPLGGVRVLDVGTGTGALAGALLRRGAASVVAVDRSTAMLDRASRRLGGMDSPAQTVRADGRHLPFGEACFDLVAIGYVLNLLDRRAALAVLREARRVMTPAGRLLVVDHSAPPTLAGRVYRAAWRALSATLPGFVAGRPLADVRPLLAEEEFSVTAERRLLAGYWSQVLIARRRDAAVRMAPGATPGAAA
jgi:ubiquinone/menaquinone biosynthesis C-methylase UbiE